MQRYSSDRSRAAQACTPTPHGGNTWHGRVLIPALVLLLGACSPMAETPVTPVAQGTQPPVSGTTTPVQAMRIIVQFRTPVPYADAAFLQTLGQQASARITYLASVSADTHVYQMEPLNNQRPAEVLQHLTDTPSVLRVEVDALAHPS